MDIKDTSSPGGQRARRMSMKSPEMGKKAEGHVPFPTSVLGTFSCHGVEPGQRQGETHAKINQDRGNVCYPLSTIGDFPSLKDYALFCVFDGHGANGDKVSQYTMENVLETLAPKLHAGKSEEAALKETFVEVDNALKKDRTIDAELSGTTAVVVLFKFLDGTKAKLWSANAGDSRAVMQSAGNKITDLTEDQKPNTPAEQARIVKCGGYVSPPEEEWGGPARVWLDANMTLPGLAMARSIGDHLVRSVGVIAEPVVYAFEVDCAKDELIVLASDGVWEFIESDQAYEILRKAEKDTKVKTDTCTGRNCTEMVTKLIETSAAKWRQEEGDYRDDITALLVDLKAAFEHRAKEGGASK